jgi:ribonuclease III
MRERKKCVPEAAGKSSRRGATEDADLAPEDHLQIRLGHFFETATLLRQALTHPSASQESGLDRNSSYERLEFLGDSLLNFSVAEILWERYPDLAEGDLSKLRAYWVSGSSLARVAREVGVAEALLLGAGEERAGGRSKERLLASVLEALVAAAYIDSGWKKARGLVRRLLQDRILESGVTVLRADHKTVLQEMRQGRGLPLPEYRTEAEGEGFRSRCILDGKAAGEGSGRSRKAAEQAAASAALDKMGK